MIKYKVKSEEDVEVNGDAEYNERENRPFLEGEAAEPSDSVKARTEAREKAYKKNEQELPNEPWGKDQFADGGLSSTAKARQERLKKTVGDASDATDGKSYGVTDAEA